MAVTFFRFCRRAYEKAKRAIRFDALAVIILSDSTTPGTITCSRPEYRSSVFSRTTTKSMSAKRVLIPGRLKTGRRLAYRSSDRRISTLTLGKPLPIGVPIGPLSAIRFRVIESRTRCGSGVPDWSTVVVPASSRSHSIARSVRSSSWATASVTSGPMPSPGIRVMRCVIAHDAGRVRRT